VVKRAAKTRKKVAVSRRSIPIVNAVVEDLFARLSEAAAKDQQEGRGARRRAGATRIPRGLAAAIADHLLAALTREASKPKKPTRPRRPRARDSRVKKA
jgi:hypothetical protein